MPHFFAQAPTGPAVPLSDLVQTMHAHAARLRALHDRIGETYPQGSRSPARRQQWEDACSDFHAQYDQLFFPGGGDAWAGFMSGHPSGRHVESALAFLQADPWYHRSGYHKQVVWNRFKRIFLAAQEKAVLEQIALQYLGRRVRWEFWHMARFVRLRGSDEWWQRVGSLARDPVRSASAIQATWLVLFKENQPVRHAIHREILRTRYEPGYQAVLDFRNRLAP